MLGKNVVVFACVCLYYEPMDFHDFELKKGDKPLHFWYRARLLLIRDLCERVFGKSEKQHRRMLDVGCGTGTELSLLASYGEVTALDVDGRALAEAGKLGYQTVDGDIATMVPPAMKYDVVACFDVLELISDDRSAIRNIFSSLTPGGYFFITVPAGQWLFSEHDAALLHQRRYAKRELLNKLADAGFNIEYVRYWNSLLFPVVALVRLIKNMLGGMRKTAPVSETQARGGVIDAVLYHILALESTGCASRLCARIPFGLSLAIIARKPL